MDRSLTEPIWQFLRGETTVREFEAWFYANEAALLPHFGEALHHDLLWLNFADHRAVEMILPRLEGVVRPLLACECPRLGDKATLSMGFDGDDQRFFATVKPVKEAGPERWFLSLGQCLCCGQYWLVVQETAFFDVYFVDRLTAEEANGIVDGDSWPMDLRGVEQLLTFARSRGRALHLGAGSIEAIYAVRQMKAARPQIEDSEIAALLGLASVDVAAILLADAEAKKAEALEAERARNPPKKSWWERLIDP